MTKNAILEAAQQLPLKEQETLVQELVDGFGTDTEDFFTPEEKAEIDRRLDAMAADPNRGIPWEQAKEEIRRGR